MSKEEYVKNEMLSIRKVKKRLSINVVVLYKC